MHTTTDLVTFFGVMASIFFALSQVPGIEIAIYGAFTLKTIFMLVSAGCGGVTAYFAKGRGDVGKV